MHSLAHDCNGYLRDVLRKVRVQRSRSPGICPPGPKKWNLSPIDSPRISWEKSQILLGKSRNPPVRSFEHRAPPDVGTPPLPSTSFCNPTTTHSIKRDPKRLAAPPVE